MTTINWKVLWLVISCLVAAIAKGQTITTVAGDGTNGYMGDNGPATNAKFSTIRGVAVDQFGNMFIADYYNNNIRKITAAGIISTLAGTGVAGYTGDGGAATAAKLNSPQGVCVDNAGNVFIADWANQVIRKVTSSGIISTVAGSGTAGYSGDNGPATAATMRYPTALFADPAGNIYVAENVNHIIRKIDPAGIITTVAGNGFGAGTGSGGYAGDGGPATAARLWTPSSVVVDPVGNIFIADCLNHVVRKVNAMGMISTVGGSNVEGYSGDEGAATLAKLDKPTGVCLDGYGNLFVADAMNNVVRKITPSGIITTVAGNGFGAGTTGGAYSGDGGPATVACLHAPVAVFVHNNTDLYIADWANYVVRKVSGIHTATPQLAATLGFTIQPNPGNGSFMISGAVNEGIDEEVMITVRNMVGAVIYEESTRLSNGRLNKQIVLQKDVPPGTYLLSLSTQGKQKSFLIIKK